MRKIAKARATSMPINLASMVDELSLLVWFKETNENFNPQMVFFNWLNK